MSGRNKRRLCDEVGVPIDGMPTLPGDTFLTATGRETTPFPKYSTKKMTKRDDKKIGQWLMDNAISEAESRFDDHNLERYKRVDVKNFSQGDCNDLALYLWGVK